MKKSFKALAVLSLFGLGLGSVTACGPGEKSIIISVDGNQIAVGESYKISEGQRFDLSATVMNGSSTDVVRWGTNAASAFTFDSTVGNEVTATANKVSTADGYQVFATLESDASVRSTISLVVNEATRTYKLTVDTSDAQTSFVQGDTFNADNLIVNVETLLNGSASGDVIELASNDYTTSIATGTVLNDLGPLTVTVTANNTEYGSATYSITVGESPSYDIISALDTISQNGFMGVVPKSGSTGTSYGWSNIMTPTFYYDGQTGYIYYEKDNEVGRYLEAYDETSGDLTGIAYVGPSYIDLKPAKNLIDVYEYAHNVNHTIFEWDSSYSSGITTQSSTSGTRVVATGDALTFFRNMFGYNNSVESFVLSYEDLNMGQVSLGTVSFTPVISGKTINELTTYYGIIPEELETGLIDVYKEVIDTKDPSVYLDKSEGYSDSWLSSIMDYWCDQEVFAYTVDGLGLTYAYEVGSDFIEGTLTQDEQTAVSGLINLDEAKKSSLPNADEEIIDATYGPGLVAYTSSGQRTVLSAAPVHEGETISNIGFWNHIPGLTPKDYKYFNFDRMKEVQFTSGSGYVTGYNFVFGLYGSEIPMLEIMRGLDPVFGDVIGIFEDNFFEEGISSGSTAVSLKPYKIEVNFYVVPTTTPEGEDAISLAGGSIYMYVADATTGENQGYLFSYQLANASNEHVADDVRNSFVSVSEATL